MKQYSKSTTEKERVLYAKPQNKVTLIPEDMGTGYIKGYVINSKLRLVVRQYELTTDFVLDRGMSEEESDFVVFAFHNIYHTTEADTKHKPFQPSVQGRLLPSVQVTTKGFNYEFLPANKKINSIVITVNADYLKELINPETENNFLETITSSNQPFLFEEIISPEIQDVAIDIITKTPAQELQYLFYKIKSEELIYLLFVELLKRQNTNIHSLNTADVKKIYLIKDKILSNIDTPPQISELANFSGFSETKFKRLFKQIFGHSVYNYYQNFRMKEAAFLIKEEKLSVSEVGYRLGFSNLSHFSRLFEKHIGMKPKKYSQSNVIFK